MVFQQINCHQPSKMRKRKKDMEKKTNFFEGNIQIETAVFFFFPFEHSQNPDGRRPQ